MFDRPLRLRTAGSTVQSPTHMNYPNFQSSSTLQQNNQNRSRVRASSATGLSLGLDLRTTQFRSGHGMPSATAQSPTSRTTPTSQLGGLGSGGGVSSSSPYTASFHTAPLTAPIDFTLPRTPGFLPAGQDYSMPQMSAPLAPPNDFSQAFQASMSGSSSRTPIRDTFGSQSQSSSDRNDDYGHDNLGGGLKRKPSFTTLPHVGGPTSTSATGSTYGNPN